MLQAELIDPKTLDPIPWREGNRGELVLTHLARQAQPLVRFRTNDLIVVTAIDVCSCGRTPTRFRVLGRSDDMIVIRGVNVYPTAIKGALSNFKELSGEFRILVQGAEPNHQIRVEAELSKALESPQMLNVQVENAIQFAVRVSIRVDLMPPYSLPRTEGKTRHIIREQ